jgi:hypothetical protein
MTRFRLLLCFLVIPLAVIAQQRFTDIADTYVSQDGKLVAKVIPSGKEKGNERAESEVQIRRKDGTMLGAHDFSSEDGEHGYGVDQAQWTTDSEFFVFGMSNSGGHMPMYHPVVFWSRKDSRFYQLRNEYTGDETFSVSPADEVQVSTWPGMKPTTVSLRNSKAGDVVALRQEPKGT